VPLPFTSDVTSSETQPSFGSAPELAVVPAAIAGASAYIIDDSFQSDAPTAWTSKPVSLALSE
jgi:hypothetical protein